MPFYHYDEAPFFTIRRRARADCRAAARRFCIASRISTASDTAARSRLTAEATELISDLQFTEAYRVPFQFSRYVRQHLPVGAFLNRRPASTTTDLDGNAFYDLTGSYGVNLFGYDFYKECIERGMSACSALGPVLGSYHPLVADNAARLVRLSGMDEVSFHMSGTEAVMQAVRLARYHTRRSHLVRFCGAYHGWWGDVQPGVGNPVPAHETYTLKTCPRPAAGAASATRHRLRPRQSGAGMHPNSAAGAIRRWWTARGRRISTARPMPIG